MASFQSLFESFVKSEISSFGEILRKKYPKKKIAEEEFWNLFVNRQRALKNVRKASSKKAVDEEEGGEKLCQAAIATGPRKGQPCGKKAVEGDYCKQHYKKFVTGGGKRKKKNTVSEEAEVLRRANIEEPVVCHAVFEGHYKHNETGLIFILDENDTKLAIGRELKPGDRKIKELTKADIELCKQWGFAYRLPTNITDRPLDDKEEALESDEDAEGGDSDEGEA